MDIPKITTFLMSNNQAGEAVKLYTSLFKDNEIIATTKYGENGPGGSGTVQRLTFTLDGQVFVAIDANSGTELPMNPAISLFVTVKDTIEMERLLSGLGDGDATLMPETNIPPYGEFTWAQDKFGVSFQLALPG